MKRQIQIDYNEESCEFSVIPPDNKFDTVICFDEDDAEDEAKNMCEIYEVLSQRRVPINKVY